MKTPKILNEAKTTSLYLLQASSNYTYLFFRNGKKEISAYTLKVFEELFDDNEYVKIDRSNLVKKDFISGIVKRKKSHAVQLINEVEIPIPRRRWSSIRKAYPDWVN